VPARPKPSPEPEEIIEAEIMEEEEEAGGAYGISGLADPKLEKETIEKRRNGGESPPKRRAGRQVEEGLKEEERAEKKSNSKRSMEEEYSDDADDEDDKFPSRRSRKKKKGAEYSPSRWDKMHLGLLLLFIGGCVLAAGFGSQTLALIITIIQSFSKSPSGGIGASKFFLQAGQVLIFGAGICSLVGYGFCLAVPTNRRGCLGLAIAGTILGILNLVFGFIYGLLFLFQDFGNSSNGFEAYVVGYPLFSMVLGQLFSKEVIPILLGLLFQAEIIVVSVFLWAVAHFWKNAGVAQSSIGVVILAGINAGFDIFLFFLPRMAPSGGSATFDWILRIVVILRNLSFLAQIIWYSLNIKGTRDSIQ
jgi:hypothetical protein